jgi:spore maturation protein CgeB
MLILYLALKYDYGHPALGHSFEHYNFFDSLRGMGHDILYFDLGKLQNPADKRRLNQRLSEMINAERPDLMFTIPFADELEPSVVKRITERSATPTIAWFCDDHWRFDSYTRYWAPSFSWCVTTARSALPKYDEIGYSNVIYSQWACNQFRYRPTGLPPRYDVTFVGQPHGDRRRWVDAIRSAGISVHVWGTGWESSRLTQEQMIEVFSTSRINLNLSNASTSDTYRDASSVDRVSAQVSKIIPAAAKRTLKQWGLRPKRNADAALPLGPLRQQIKGRNFEVPGCGGFMLTGQAEGLEQYYENQREIVCFDSVPDLIEKIRYYLAHEDDRHSIARAGYQRTINDHTYVHRFSQIFDQLGLATPDAATILAKPPSPGTVTDVT